MFTMPVIGDACRPYSYSNYLSSGRNSPARCMYRRLPTLATKQYHPSAPGRLEAAEMPQNIAPSQLTV